MSHFLRLVYVIAGTVANAIQTLIFFRIGTQLFEMGSSGGEYAGTFSNAMGWLEAAWMVEIVILQLGLLAYLIYGPVVRERTRRQVTAR
jgi:hypothetical protein